MNNFDLRRAFDAKDDYLVKTEKSIAKAFFVGSLIGVVISLLICGLIYLFI